MPAELPQPRASAGAASVSEIVPAARTEAGRWICTAIVLLLFGAYGLIRAPVPAVNEPHYLTKAKHFWDPEWCSRDLFLNSADAHWTFYATIGALTRVLSLEQVAYVGRILVWLALAAGWVALVAPMVPARFGPAWAAAFFLAISATGNLSGEWLIGGVEAKGFSYAALLLALAAGGARRWNWAAVCTGLSISFHPVVGGWGLVAGTLAVIWGRLAEHPGKSAAPASLARAVGLPASLCLLCALPGLIPAATMLLGGTPPDVQQAADAIQVFDRLDHHLDPRQFSRKAWIGYDLLLAALLLLRPWSRGGEAGCLFFRFFAGALMIAMAGAAIGFGPRWAGLMKFYPFRLIDVILPMALAVAVAERLTNWLAGPKASDNHRLGLASGWCAAAAACAWAFAAPAPDRNSSGLPPARLAAWKDACAWVAGHTPADALFLTPRYNFGFRWYAGRAEYASWKDCPQDAVSLVEWKRRLDEIHDWRERWWASGFTPDAIADLRDRSDVDYVLAWGVDPFRVEPVYRNEAFAVYRVSDRADARPVNEPTKQDGRD